MEPRKTSVLIRAIPALIITGSIIALALWWTRDSDRGGIFYYFLALMVYACVMCFFSDVIFLGGRKSLRVRLPILAVAAIHASYALALVLLYAVFSRLDAIYFIIATLIATGLQVSLSLWIFLGAKNIDGQQKALDQKANVRIARELLLGDLQNAFKASPQLAGDAEIMRKLTVLCNAWKTSSPQDTENTMQTTAEIGSSVQSLIGMASSGNAETDAVAGQITAISALIERRNKLLTMK